MLTKERLEELVNKSVHAIAPEQNVTESPILAYNSFTIATGITTHVSVWINVSDDDITIQFTMYGGPRHGVRIQSDWVTKGVLDRNIEEGDFIDYLEKYTDRFTKFVPLAEDYNTSSMDKIIDSHNLDYDSCSCDNWSAFNSTGETYGAHVASYLSLAGYGRVEVVTG